MEYRILWLDDLSQEDDINEAKMNKPNVKIDYVQFIDICRQQLESSANKYDAVIFDANNQNSEKPVSPEDATKSGLLDLVKYAKEDLHILVYIYSAELSPNGVKDEIVTREALSLYGLKEGETIFSKTKPFDELLGQIIRDLNNKNQYYVGHEYLLDIFKKGWMDAKYKTQFLDPLMKIYSEQKVDDAHGNLMRNFFEGVLDRLYIEYEKKSGKKSEKKKSYDSIIKELCRENRPHNFMWGPFFHINSITNILSHFAINNDKDRELFFQSDYHTFFLVTHWFYNYMNNQHSECDDSPISSSAVNNRNEDKKNDEKRNNDKQRDTRVVYVYQDCDGKYYFDAKVKVKGYKEGYFEVPQIRPDYFDSNGWYAQLGDAVENN